jgi:carboxypeptidase Taq
MSAAADALRDHLRRISALERVAGLLGWDQETQMPRRGAAQRAEEAGAVAGALHALMADPSLRELCDAAEAGSDAVGAVNVAEGRRIFARATRVPGRLASEIAHATAEAQDVWQAARKARSYPDLVPALTRVVALRREEAERLAEPGQDPYDALLADYEPGMTGERLAALFGELRPRLSALRARIAERGEGAPALKGDFPAAAQVAFCRRLGDVFGYDWAAGRLDLAAHPSSSGRLGDVRITTRTSGDPLESIYSTIHELGHALYEQGLDPETALTPAGPRPRWGCTSRSRGCWRTRSDAAGPLRNGFTRSCARRSGRSG